jgi:hypothetical protein
MRRSAGPVSKEQIAEIAAVQHAIEAVEAVIVDLDAETYPASRERHLHRRTGSRHGLEPEQPSSAGPFDHRRDERPAPAIQSDEHPAGQLGPPQGTRAPSARGTRGIDCTDTPARL